MRNLITLVVLGFALAGCGMDHEGVSSTFEQDFFGSVPVTPMGDAGVMFPGDGGPIMVQPDAWVAPVPDAGTDSAVVIETDAGSDAYVPPMDDAGSDAGSVAIDCGPSPFTGEPIPPWMLMSHTGPGFVMYELRIYPEGPNVIGGGAVWASSQNADGSYSGLAGYPFDFGSPNAAMEWLACESTQGRIYPMRIRFLGPSDASIGVYMDGSFRGTDDLSRYTSNFGLGWSGPPAGRTLCETVGARFELSRCDASGCDTAPLSMHMEIVHTDHVVGGETVDDCLGIFDS